jgi:hypothetical protein
MESIHPSMTRLFDQIGLPSAPEAVQHFIALHRPLPSSIHLADATFWTAGQSQFLRQELADDAEWSLIVDRLDAALRDAEPERWSTVRRQFDPPGVIDEN